MRHHTTDIDFTALAEFRYQIRRFLSFSHDAARAMRIEPQQHQALLAIKGMPDGEAATVGELAKRLHIRHHSAVELADRLQVRRLISRTRSGSDRRQVQLRLTARGEQVLGDLSRAHREELRSRGRDLIKALNAVMHHRPKRAAHSSKRARPNKIRPRAARISKT